MKVLIYIVLSFLAVGLGVVIAPHLPGFIEKFVYFFRTNPETAAGISAISIAINIICGLLGLYYKDQLIKIIKKGR